MVNRKVMIKDDIRLFGCILNGVLVQLVLNHPGEHEAKQDEKDTYDNIRYEGCINPPADATHR